MSLPNGEEMMEECLRMGRLRRSSASVQGFGGEERTGLSVWPGWEWEVEDRSPVVSKKQQIHLGGAEQYTRSAVDVGRDPDRHIWGKPHKTNGANGPPGRLTLPDPTVLDQDFSQLGQLSGDYLRRQIWSSGNSIWSQEQRVKTQSGNADPEMAESDAGKKGFGITQAEILVCVSGRWVNQGAQLSPKSHCRPSVTPPSVQALSCCVPVPLPGLTFLLFLISL